MESPPNIQTTPGASAPPLKPVNRNFLSNFFLEHSIPVLIILFALGAIVIFTFINYQQNILTQSVVRQEESIYKQLGYGVNSALPPRGISDLLFQESRSSLQKTFFILLLTLGVFLLLISFIILKLKEVSKKSLSYADHVQFINNELAQEMTKRKEIEVELEDLNTRLRYQSLHDKLTGLPNRQLFEDRLNVVLATSKRYKQRFAVMFLDLDGFKTINDTLGHDVGDDLLQQVGQRIGGSIRDADTFSRLGGDEFTIIATQIENTISASYLAERVLKLLTKPFVLKGEEHFVTASIGITTYPDDSDEPKGLLKNADIAMYNAKKNGGNNFQYYRENLNVEAQRQLIMKSSLATALKNNELLIHYQPIMNVTTSEIVSLEALLRWQHPELGLLSPGEFIPFVEKQNYMITIDEWLLKRVCTQYKTWNAQNFSVKNIAINVSLAQIFDGYIEKLTEIIQAEGIEPACLSLELPEFALVKDADKIREKLVILKKLGLRITLEGFGAGYSSVNFLKDFPLDTLKIDRSLVQNLEINETTVATIKNILTVAKSFNFTVIAAGVETAKQKQILLDLGCIFMQGYYFGYPVAPEEYLR